MSMSRNQNWSFLRQIKAKKNLTGLNFDGSFIYSQTTITNLGSLLATGSQVSSTLCVITKPIPFLHIQSYFSIFYGNRGKCHSD